MRIREKTKKKKEITWVSFQMLISWLLKSTGIQTRKKKNCFPWNLSLSFLYFLCHSLSGQPTVLCGSNPLHHCSEINTLSFTTDTNKPKTKKKIYPEKYESATETTRTTSRRKNKQTSKQPLHQKTNNNLSVTLDSLLLLVRFGAGFCTMQQK